MFQFGSPALLDLGPNVVPWHRPPPPPMAPLHLSAHQSSSPSPPLSGTQSLALTQQPSTKMTAASGRPSSILLDVGSLSADQLECLCLVLENCANFHGLAHLLAMVEASDPHDAAFASQMHQSILHRAKAVLLFHQSRFDEFRRHIQANHFAQRDHGHLQMLWNEAHYRETEQQRGKRLDPVSRYRVRKKNGFPASIWDGEGTSYCFKKSAREQLRKAYQQNPVPNQQQKTELAKKTQLSALQVSNWFKNQRQRARQHQRQQQQLMARRAKYNGEENDEEDDEEADEGDYASDGAESEEQFCCNGHRQSTAAAGQRRQQRRCPKQELHSEEIVGHHFGQNDEDDGQAAFGWAKEEEEEWGRQQRRKGNQQQ